MNISFYFNICKYSVTIAVKKSTLSVEQCPEFVFFWKLSSFYSRLFSHYKTWSQKDKRVDMQKEKKEKTTQKMTYLINLHSK